MGDKEGKGWRDEERKERRRGRRRRRSRRNKAAEEKKRKFHRAPATSTRCSPPAAKPLWAALSVAVAPGGGFAAGSGRFCSLLGTWCSLAAVTLVLVVSVFSSPGCHRTGPGLVCCASLTAYRGRLDLYMPQAGIENVPPSRSQSACVCGCVTVRYTLRLSFPRFYARLVTVFSHALQYGLHVINVP